VRLSPNKALLVFVQGALDQFGPVKSLTRKCIRYRTLCYWLYAERSVLNPRLDARVDDMVQVRSVI
jgi:tRNA A37 N6-isopentenylltransferase MiaA